MNIFNKVQIHFLYYIVAFICIITGMFKEFIYFTLIIVVHELGHILPSILYKWKIEKIVILPFGGITIFNENINRPLKEELLIVLMGPIFQCIVYYIGSYFISYDLIIYNYHYAILFFNLLPIYPLDGSKIINIIFNKFLSFKKSHIVSIYLSYIILLLTGFVLYSMTFSYLIILILLFLLLKVIDENKKHEFIFNRFLFERYLYQIKFKKRKVIKGDQVNKMKRDYKHLFYLNNKYHTEDTLLSKRFDKQSDL